MKVQVGFVGFSGLESILGSTKELALDLGGDTFDDLLSALDVALLRRICHEGHTIDSGVMVLRNDARVDSRNLNQKLAAGDRISFVRMVAGG